MVGAFEKIFGFIGGNAAMGVLILPIMLYHQMQLFACAVLARRYAARVSHEVVRHDAAS